MPCPLCGDICRCSSAAYLAAPPHAGPETPEANASSLPPPNEASAPSLGNQSALDDSPAWRQEVAARLFLSHKTVEVHLGHIYDKLGVRSRTSLARLVHSSAVQQLPPAKDH